MAIPLRSSREGAAVVLLTCLLLMMSRCAEAGNHGRRIIVGGDEHWRFGYNYSAWADKCRPFFVGDTLVFKYQPSVFNGMPVNHNVYRLHGFKQFQACSFGPRAVLLANTTQGVPGYEFTLTESKKNYFFACGIGEGIHCNEGLMKFHVRPR